MFMILKAAIWRTRPWATKNGSLGGDQSGSCKRPTPRFAPSREKLWKKGRKKTLKFQHCWRTPTYPKLFSFSPFFRNLSLGTFLLHQNVFSSTKSWSLVCADPHCILVSVEERNNFGAGKQTVGRDWNGRHRSQLPTHETSVATRITMTPIREITLISQCIRTGPGIGVGGMGCVLAWMIKAWAEYYCWADRNWHAIIFLYFLEVPFFASVFS